MSKSVNPKEETVRVTRTLRKRLDAESDGDTPTVAFGTPTKAKRGLEKIAENGSVRPGTPLIKKASSQLDISSPARRVTRRTSTQSETHEDVAAPVITRRITRRMSTDEAPSPIPIANTRTRARMSLITTVKEEESEENESVSPLSVTTTRSKSRSVSISPNVAKSVDRSTSQMADCSVKLPVISFERISINLGSSNDSDEKERTKYPRTPGPNSIKVRASEDDESPNVSKNKNESGVEPMDVDELSSVDQSMESNRTENDSATSSPLAKNKSATSSVELKSSPMRETPCKSFEKASTPLRISTPPRNSPKSETPLHKTLGKNLIEKASTPTRETPVKMLATSPRNSPKSQSGSEKADTPLQEIFKKQTGTPGKETPVKMLNMSPRNSPRSQFGSEKVDSPVQTMFEKRIGTPVKSSPTRESPVKQLGTPGRDSPKSHKGFEKSGTPMRDTPKKIGTPLRNTPKFNSEPIEIMSKGSPKTPVRKTPGKQIGTPARDSPNTVFAASVNNLSEQLKSGESDHDSVSVSSSADKIEELYTSQIDFSDNEEKETSTKIETPGRTTHDIFSTSQHAALPKVAVVSPRSKSIDEVDQTQGKSPNKSLKNTSWSHAVRGTVKEGESSFIDGYGLDKTNEVVSIKSAPKRRKSTLIVTDEESLSEPEVAFDYIEDEAMEVREGEESEIETEEEPEGISLGSEDTERDTDDEEEADGSFIASDVDDNELLDGEGDDLEMEQSTMLIKKKPIRALPIVSSDENDSNSSNDNQKSDDEVKQKDEAENLKLHYTSGSSNDDEDEDMEENKVAPNANNRKTSLAKKSPLKKFTGTADNKMNKTKENNSDWESDHDKTILKDKIAAEQILGRCQEYLLNTKAKRDEIKATGKRVIDSIKLETMREKKEKKMKAKAEKAERLRILEEKRIAKVEEDKKRAIEKRLQKIEKKRLLSEVPKAVEPELKSKKQKIVAEISQASSKSSKKSKNREELPKLTLPVTVTSSSSDEKSAYNALGLNKKGKKAKQQLAQKRKLYDDSSDLPAMPVDFKLRYKPPTQTAAPKKSAKKRRIDIADPVTVLPKPVWTAAGAFMVENYPAPTPSHTGSVTDFNVITIKGPKKKLSRSTSEPEPSAVKYKKNLLKERPERLQSSKELLRRQMKYKANFKA